MELLSSVRINHVEFFVQDVEEEAATLAWQYGFTVAGRTPAAVRTHRSTVLRNGAVAVVLTEGVDPDHPAGRYVRSHGDGLAVIGLRTADTRLAFDLAVKRGATPVAPPSTVGPGDAVVASISAFGDTVHTFVQSPTDAGSDLFVPGIGHLAGAEPAGPLGFGAIDHFAVCVPAGGLAPLIAHYESVLGFRRIFQEHVVIGRQAMNSEVVQNVAGDLTFTVLEPDETAEPGQIDEFVDAHGGAGVQHIALTTPDIVASMGAMRERGVRFLDIPESYYTALPLRLTPLSHDARSLQEMGVLVDADHYGQLFQTFTRSVHPRRTFFFELIERVGARTFGSGNIKALYTAVEMDGVGSAGPA